MKTELMTKVRDALLTVLPTATYHYIAAPRHPDQYIVWQEDSSNDLKADNITVGESLTGTADLFSKTEYSPLIDGIEKAFENAGIAYELNSTQYESDTGFIHFEWVWSV